MKQFIHYLAVFTGFMLFGLNLFAQDRDTLSTSERNKYELTASPNPFENEVTITINEGNKNLTSVRIFDILGTEVAFIDLRSKSGVISYKLDFSNLPSGMYFCNVYGTGGIIETKRISHRR